jgi:tRNA(adenine34) deaminase
MFDSDKCIHFFMQEAYRLAQLANKNNEVPIGAIVVKNKKIIGRGFNQVIEKNSVACHAEINAIADAGKAIKNYRLKDCDLYVTLEPCHMCAKAIVDARIKRLFFGAYEPKTGAVKSTDQFFDREHLNHQVIYHGGLMADESSKLLQDFFKKRRGATKKDLKISF